MFAGNLGFIAMLDKVLDAAKLLEGDPHIQFLIVGEGNAKADLVSRAGELGLKNVRFLPTQPKDVLPQMLGAADLSLVTLNKRLGQLNVPSKTYSIMASARPVLASVPKIPRSHDWSKWPIVEKASRQKTHNRWRRPSSGCPASRKSSRVYGANGRRYVEECLARRRLTTQYHNLLQQVVDRRKL